MSQIGAHASLTTVDIKGTGSNADPDSAIFCGHLHVSENIILFAKYCTTKPFVFISHCLASPPVHTLQLVAW